MRELERTVDEIKGNAAAEEAGRFARFEAEMNARFEAMRRSDAYSPSETAQESPAKRTPTESQFPWATDEQMEAHADRTGLISSDEMSALLGVSRQTTNRWREEGKLLGFVIAKRGYLYPREQVNERGQPLLGLDKIIGRFAGDHWAAWRFLASELPELDGQTGFAAISGGKIGRLLNVIAARDDGSFS